MPAGEEGEIEPPPLADVVDDGACWIGMGAVDFPTTVTLVFAAGVGGSARDVAVVGEPGIEEGAVDDDVVADTFAVGVGVVVAVANDDDDVVDDVDLALGVGGSTDVGGEEAATFC